ncbi:MAG TPA: hypothetical protein PLM59_10205, partial [Oscillospiraceae bacterium]|nr:hypothetical protein [Oscillospiraceae bacterium]
EDMTGSMEGIVFPKVFEECRSLLKDDAVLEFFGHISFKDEEDAKLIVDKVSLADDFVESCKRMNLCIRLSSKNETLLQKTLEIIKSDGGKGASKVCFYFEDIKKLASHKSCPEILISAALLDKLFKAIGEDNIAFM